MKYRIVKKTLKSGEEWYYIQEKFLFFFWRYKTQLIGMNYSTYIMYNLFADAIEAVRILSNYDYDAKMQKAVKTEIIQPPY